MEQEQALFLANCIEKSTPAAYEIKKLDMVGGTLPKFHQWTNGKKTLAAYEVTRPATETGYYFVFIDWHRNGIYYLVIYAHDKKTTVAELRQIQEIDDVSQIVWSYKPFKRDGKNDQRKAYFTQMFGSRTVHIELPTAAEKVEAFFEQVFKLCQNRIKADRIVDVFDFEN
ncbi:hypothetical protein [Neobacillus vireti]|uniref:Uncharacterized protein n=1 Tax=Neobacillus vireti LMG 21834 TaxID=1131730 RepID=A0AB94IUX2_9BACI|nr:hypothetical protein [Neobacillus vireti]ETI70884.1 hypothetical protein BAVI_00755 [Neobacillus vireti LMG 21834]KLT17586.1 hypothetical protein AA980_10690 [Neobacillus vireti]